MAITKAGSTGVGLGGPGSSVIPKFYADFMRDRLWSSLYFRQFGTDVTVPHGYENVKIPRWRSPYTISDYQPSYDSSFANISQIAEDGSITPGQLSASSIEGSVVIFAGAIGYTEKAMLVSHASITDGAMENLVRELALRIDDYTIGQISSTAETNKMIAGSDSTVGTSDTLDGAEIAKIGPKMDSWNVPRWEDETFVCVIHPLVAYDVMTDSAQTGFLEIAKYTDPSDIYRGEIGRLYGIRFIVSNNVKCFDSGASPSDSDFEANVKGTYSYIIAPDAYYTITQEGGGVQVIHHPPGSAGTSDPVNLQGTIGVKVYYGVVAAPAADHRLARLKHAVSLYDGS